MPSAVVTKGDRTRGFNDIVLKQKSHDGQGGDVHCTRQRLRWQALQDIEKKQVRRVVEGTLERASCSPVMISPAIYAAWKVNVADTELKIVQVELGYRQNSRDSGSGVVGTTDWAPSPHSFNLLVSLLHL